MEKIAHNGRIVKIAITGSESTGKTELAKQLASHFETVYIPEYAREYVEALKRPYNYLDVIHIARKQIELERKYFHMARRILFYDTELIISKVWLEMVYGHCPSWIIEAIRHSSIDLYLLCDTDIPWIPDPVRENGGEMREKLMAIYCKNMDDMGLQYQIVRGSGPSRLKNALEIISNYMY